MIGKVEDKFFKSTEASYYLKDRLEKGTCKQEQQLQQYSHY